MAEGVNVDLEVDGGFGDIDRNSHNQFSFNNIDAFLVSLPLYL